MVKRLIYKFPVSVQLFLHKIAICVNCYFRKGNIFVNKAVCEFYAKECDSRYLTLKKDIKKSYIKYLAKPSEYFLFDFENKTPRQRKEYLTDIQKDVYCEKYDGIVNFNKLSDKFFFYEKMKKFYHRDACLISKPSDKTSFFSFVSKHPSFIAKLNSGSFGRNTMIINTQDRCMDEIFNNLLNAGSWIVEDIIHQVPEMAKFNDSSVNSVRVPTFMCNGEVVVFGTFMRTGRSGSIVDNAGSGGIFFRIDEKSGVCISDGYAENGFRYKTHPDSGIEFKGFQVPKWDEVLLLAKKCHRTLPDHKYIGWDFALTENGWILIEGNWGQFLCQQVSGEEPMKKDFVSLIKCNKYSINKS